MNLETYKTEAMKTSNQNFPQILSRISSDQNLQLLHGALGLSTEAGELEDALKKHIFYGKELKPSNILEECGDAMWYINLILDAYGFSWEQAMEVNIKKLRKRLGTSFSGDRAINRDLSAENKILEEGSSEEDAGSVNKIGC